MEQNSNKGMIAMILGIAAIVLSLIDDFAPLGYINLALVFVALAVGIVAIVFGVKGRKQGGNTGMATAGLVTGIIAVVFAGISCVCVICTVACATAVIGGVAQEIGQSDLSALSELLQ